MTRLVDQVRLTFDLAALRQEAKRDLSASDWSAYRHIQETSAHRRNALEQDFALTYGDRVAEARKRLFDEASGKTLDLVPRLIGRDRFNNNAIDRQAHKEVQLAHRSALVRIDQDEARQIEGLLDRAGPRTKAGERFQRDFTIATDRRGGPDRRKRHH